MLLKSGICKELSIGHLVWVFGLALLMVGQSCTKDDDDARIEGSVTAATALENYLNVEDEAFSWQVREVYDQGLVTVHVLALTSQKWREHTWVHELKIFVPQEIDHDGALLFISGGSVRNGEPQWTSQNDNFSFAASLVATKNKAVTAILQQTPNQPLFGGLTEDALISFTLHNFKADNDYTWPLLFPMVKSAHRAMDVLSAYGTETLGHSINRFVVSGASKRGWTTWLTAATDRRVEAIVPMVIDVLNMPVNLSYQLEVWEDYSPQISDYVELGIVQEVGTLVGDELTQMIDPFSYRDRLNVPKLIVIGTNDEFWPIDAVKHYFDELPGNNFLHYVPNAGHDLSGGEPAIAALSAFMGYALRGEKNPSVDWELQAGANQITLAVAAASDRFVEAALWQADSPDRDFRDGAFSRKKLDAESSGSFEISVDFPADGFRAFYVELVFEDPNGGQYSKSTRVYVADSEEVFF